MLTQGWVSLRGRRVLQRTAVGTCFVIVSLMVVGSTRVSVLRHGKPAGAAGMAGSANPPKLAAAYGKLPMGFEINRGQTDSRVKFLSRGKGYTLFLTGNEAVLALRNPSPAGNQRSAFLRSRLKDSSAQRSSLSAIDLPSLLPPPARSYTGQPEMTQSQSGLPTPHGSVLRMRLVGGNPVASNSGMNELPGKSNYFIGNDPKKWRTHVPTYAKVKYTDVYPGVDLVYYGHQGQLEYDFVVNPRADPRQIALAVDYAAAPSGERQSTHGAPALQIDSGGDLLVGTGEGQVRFHKPVVYQPSTSYQLTAQARVSLPTSKEILDGKFSLAGDHVTFDVASYDKSKPLVIDPMLTYSTYLGGSGGDSGSSIAVDASGNAYIAGGTSSSDFPITPDAFQPTSHSSGEGDAFVTKLNASGSSLVYSTYLGGSADADGSAIAVDASGNAYITGGTKSADFATTPGAFQSTLGGAAGKAFVTKLNADGSALVYSTYLGGTTATSTGFGIQYSGSGIAVDTLGEAYVTGSTSFIDFPTTVGAFQTTFDGGARSAFVSKLNPAGSALVYSTYLGGGNAVVAGPPSPGQDDGLSIALEVSGSAYVTGSTNSVNFPTTAGAFQPACTLTSLAYGSPPSCVSAFVTKLNPAGSALVYSTYLSPILGNPLVIGIGAFGIAIDASGNAYVTGATDATGFPVTPGAFQTTFDNQYSKGIDAFVTKLNTAGSALIYSTYLGIGAAQQGQGIAVDAAGEAFVTGYTEACDFPTTPDAFQTSHPGVTICGGSEEVWSSSVFLTKLNPAGAALLYSTYLDGTVGTGSGGAGIAIDSSGNIYVTGATGDVDFPTTAGAFQTTYAANGDAFVAKFSFISLPAATLTPSSLTFTSQAVGTQSPSQVEKLANTGGAPLVIEDIRDYDKKEFYVQDGCGGERAALAPGASCTITVTFTPTRDGSLSGAIKIFDNATGSPQEVSLQGTGTGVSPIVRLEPDHPITFAPREVGTRSEPKTVPLINAGNARLHISAITASQDFDQTNNCRDTLAPDARCEVWVTFRPRVTGSLSGWLTFTDDSPGSPQMISLAGTGENKHGHR